MTKQNKRDIFSLYFIHRFTPANIARLYGVSHQDINRLVSYNRNIMVISDTSCLLCGLETAKTYYIDGNRSNKKPQNIITLCDADKRRLEHLQLRRRGPDKVIAGQTEDD